MWLWVSQLGEEGGVLEIGWAHCGVVLWQIDNVYHGIVIVTVNVCKENFAGSTLLDLYSSYLVFRHFEISCPCADIEVCSVTN